MSDDSYFKRYIEASQANDRLTAQLAEVSRERDGWRKAFEIGEDNAKRNAASLANLDALLDRIEETTSDRDRLQREVGRYRAFEERHGVTLADIEAPGMSWTHDAAIEKLRRIANLARRVVSRGMHNRTANRDEFLPNDIEALKKLADAIDAAQAAEGEGK